MGDVTDYLNRSTEYGDPAVASALDELSLWSARFGTVLLNHLELRPNLDVLDLGCGTGFPLFELAHVLGPTCRLTGVDLWGEGLDRAAAKARVHQLANVLLVRADGARLPLADGRFDLIVSNLGVNNFADPAAALAECRRVARPGARLALTTNLRGCLAEGYAAFRTTLTALGFSRHLDRLRANEDHRTTRTDLTALVAAAGFRVTRVMEDAFTLRYLDGSALLRHSLTRFGFLDGWRRVVDPAEETTVFAALEARLNEEARAAGELRMTVPRLYLEAVAV
jgi:ubiquinone/menaquinone biosynthesis C-methylase UbiE